jgi:hypothetical protein
LPVIPVPKYCAVYTLRFELFHGMEEVIGSIPIRSTNKSTTCKGNNILDKFHRLNSEAVHTAGTRGARTVRVQVLTPPGTLSRPGQKSLVADATKIVAKIAADPTQGERTWVLLTEAAEGGRGIADTAFGREEFAALAAKKSATT